MNFRNEEGKTTNEQVAICRVCGTALFKKGGPPWLTGGSKGTPVCNGPCLQALAKWSNNTMNLFQLVDEFKMHSGGVSRFKIECDALSDEDWECLAFLASERCPNFDKVIGIPRGGIKFAEALVKYVTPGSNLTLIADDVLTTGSSMIEMREDIEGEDIEGDSTGVVAFARGPSLDWVTPLFTLS